MKNVVILFVCLLALPALSAAQSQQNFQPSDVDYEGFMKLSEEVEPYRLQRLVDFNTFLEMAKHENTIILDTRSKEAYDNIHLRGAIHLNFSDFTEEKLAKIIPSKQTRILIYCNNNFANGPEFLTSKAIPLALNVPTFINLYGYGYKNVYELSELLTMDDERLVTAGVDRD